MTVVCSVALGYTYLPPKIDLLNYMQQNQKVALHALYLTIVKQFVL